MVEASCTCACRSCRAAAGDYADGDLAAVVLFSQDPNGDHRDSIIEVLPSAASVGRGGCQPNDASAGLVTGFINAPELTRVFDLGLTEAEYDPCPVQ